MLRFLRKFFLTPVFKYLDTNNQLDNNQSGFHPGDSYMHQLPPVIQIIYKASEANPLLELRGIFLDLLKAFDNVCHKGLMTHC